MAVKVAMIGCSAYMNSGYGCPGEYKCLRAPRLKDGEFSRYDEPVEVVGFLKCECPGRALVSNVGELLKNEEADAIHFTTCMVKAQPPCPNMEPEKWARAIEEKFGIKCVLGTHDYG